MHRSVLLKEVLEYLAPQRGEVFLDCTVNGGGHAEAIAEFLGEKGVVVGIDEDQDALEAAKKRLEGTPPKKHLYLGNFRNLDRALQQFSLAETDMILFDLGLSSRQLELSGRGFSFQRDEPLLMTFTAAPREDDRLTAEEIVNEWDEENIATILESYGEERFAKRIARAIVSARSAAGSVAKNGKIERAHALAEIVKDAIPLRYRKGKTHPATKTFQAIRMAVNDEVRALKEGLAKAWKALAPGGRMAVISFHSREDRIVKNFFKKLSAENEGKILTKKPLSPSRAEARENPRSRSAKLRVMVKE